MIDLNYYNGENEVGEGNFRISASGISRYFTGTSSWYRENLTDLDEGFKGNTSSCLGTLCHGFVEAYLKNDVLDLNTVNDYLVKQSTIIDDLDVNRINHQYPIMTNTILNWLSSNIDRSEVTSEPFIHKELLPGITVGGSCDWHTGNSGQTVYDLKTTSAKTLPKTIQYSHRLQLLTYSKLLIDQGINIKYISIVYLTVDDCGRVSEKTGKPLTQYPSKVVELKEPVTQEDLDMIGNIHDVIAESVEMFRDNIGMRHLLSQDMRLKGVKCNLIKPEEEI